MVSVAMAMECWTKCLRLAVSFLEDRNSAKGLSRKSVNRIEACQDYFTHFEPSQS